MSNTRAVDIVTPRFVRAKGPNALESKMKSLIMKSGKQYDFYCIYFANGFHYAWYREQIEMNTLLSNKKQES